MALLQRLLAAMVSEKVQRATAVEEAVTDPLTTSLRVPSDVRRQYELLASGLGISLQQTMLLALRALMDQGWHHPETALIASRLQRVFPIHGIHAVDVHAVHPALTAETLHDDLALLRVADRSLVEAVGNVLHINPRWLAGERLASPVTKTWYETPDDPIVWASERRNGTVIAYVVRVQGARWEKSIPEDDYNDPQPQTQMALILQSYEHVSSFNYPLYRMWGFERISDERVQVVARIVLSRLSNLDIQLRGITISEETYLSFKDNELLPIELVKNRINRLGWSVQPLLYGADGPYREKDKYLSMQGWAGGDEFASPAAATEPR